MYSEHPPAPMLRPVVRCFWAFRDDDPLAYALERIAPDGSPELVFHFGAQPELVIVGQISAPLMLERQGRADILGVRFTASGARHLGLPPMQELTDQRIDIRALGRPQLWQGLERILDAGQQQGSIERIAALEVFFLSALGPIAAPDLADHAVHDIAHQGGQTRIDQLAKHYGISARQLERRFLQAVGLSPKAYSRIVRFERACQLARNMAWSDWSRVAAECGYFDQAHLVLDFQHFTGQAPGEFAASLTPLNAAILHHPDDSLR